MCTGEVRGNNSTMKRKPSKKSCHKVGYRSKAKARRAFKLFGKQRGCTYVYKCPHHDTETWHLTSQEKNGN